jgi:hypothetical protein
MKKIYTLTTAVALIISCSINAQERGNRNGESNKGESKDHVRSGNTETRSNQTRPTNVQQPQIKTQRAPIGETTTNNGVRNNNRHEPIVRTPNTTNINRPTRNNDYRNNDNRNNGTRNTTTYNRNTQTRQSNDARFGRDNRYNRVDRNYYPDYRRPYSFYGQRYTSFYGYRYHVPYMGLNYYYSGGFFYQPFDSYFQVIAAPIGIRIYGLPWGYRKWYIGPSLYYYYGGTYYRNVNNYYEVVDAPMGSILPELPSGSKSVVINDQQYFEKNGTYYKETLKDGETWYTIVGKNGSLTTTTDTMNEVNTMVGDMVTDLPENCKTVVLNNQKYYVSESDVYYQEVISDNSIYYKVVAKP